MQTGPPRLACCPAAARARHLGLLSIGLLLVSCKDRSLVPAQRVWLDRITVNTSDRRLMAEDLQPPPLLLGCRYPGCFPGYSGEGLRLEAEAHGPFLKRWLLDIRPLPGHDQKALTVGGDAHSAVPIAISLGTAGKVSNLRMERGVSLPVAVELDFGGLRSLAAKDCLPVSTATELKLEIRQFAGRVEVQRWRFVYDFSALLPPSCVATDALRPGGLPADGPTRRDAASQVSLTPNLWIEKPAAPALVSLDDLSRCDFAVANHLFSSNGIGVELHYVLSTKSGTQDTKVRELCDGIGDLKGQPVFVGNNLNIYYVHMKTAAQMCCLQDVPHAMFVTDQAVPTTLAHELGHSFGLSDYPCSDNIMQGGGGAERRALTDPQIYLMIFGGESTLNSLPLRTTGVVRSDCTSQCKAGAFRSFQEGCDFGTVDLSACPSGPIQALLTDLASDEENPAAKSPLDQEKLTTIDGVALFLGEVLRKGPNRFLISREVQAVRGLLTKSECPVNENQYVALYTDRIVRNARLRAANQLFTLRTPEALDILQESISVLPDDVRKHVDGLLSQW